MVFGGCALNMFSERFAIDLLSILLMGLKVIIRIDWLVPNGVVIDCEWQLVRVQTLSGGEQVISEERTTHGPTLCSAASSKRFL